MTQASDDPEAYEKAREDARMRVVEDSMMRALGRGRRGADVPAAAGAYDPHAWVRW